MSKKQKVESNTQKVYSLGLCHSRAAVPRLEFFGGRNSVLTNTSEVR